MRGPQWRWLPWVRLRRARLAARQAILDAAIEEQRREYERAIRRRLAHNAPWNAPTVAENRPLMTLGAEHRSRQGRRWSP